MSDYTPQGRPGDEAVRWSRGGGPAPSASVQSTIHQMTDQLQTVIEAAERAAEAIRHDAEEQARRHLAEAQRKADRLTAERVGLISELTDDLIRHAANVRDHSEQMVRALEDAINSVTDKLEQPAMSDPLGAAVATPSLPLGDQPARERTACSRSRPSAGPRRLHRPRRHPAAPAAGIGSGSRPPANHAARPVEPTDRRTAADARRCRGRGGIAASERARHPAAPGSRSARRGSPTPARRRSPRAHLRGAAYPVPGALDGLRSSRRSLGPRRPTALECAAPRARHRRAGRLRGRRPSCHPPGRRRRDPRDDRQHVASGLGSERSRSDRGSGPQQSLNRDGGDRAEEGRSALFDVATGEQVGADGAADQRCRHAQRHRPPATAGRSGAARA